ncbi:hypothetical protein, partial [Neoaquamicrobium sediminum]|uniref:hypothetical protein n=1 Tax=Neoaquamicrobium sediminum TaxID=1849104 RepID=UPI004035879C
LACSGIVGNKLNYWSIWSSQKGRSQLCKLLLQLLRITLLACNRLIGLYTHSSLFWIWKQTGTQQETKHVAKVLLCIADQELALLLTSQTV